MTSPSPVPQSTLAEDSKHEQDEDEDEMAQKFSRSLLLASIGNPGAAYANTRHSAGHILLAALALARGAPPLRRERRFWASGEVAVHRPADAVFWRSPTFMNECGPGVARVWRSHLQLLPKLAETARLTPNEPTALKVAAVDAAALKPPADTDMDAPHLIVVHDELELPLGKFKLSTAAGASARGHNGLKSILGTQELRATTFSRLGVGIGPRPASREPDQVARFVLANLSEEQRARIEALAGPVWDALEELRGRADVKKKDPPRPTVRKTNRKEPAGTTELVQS